MPLSEVMKRSFLLRKVVTKALTAPAANDPRITTMKSYKA